MGAFFYSIHFFVPTIFAFIVWSTSPQNYWKYTVSFGVLTYSALITFLFYPVAPMDRNPKRPTNLNRISRPKTRHTRLQDTLRLPEPQPIRFPSMHSAIPWLVFLYAFKIWKWKALQVAIIPVGTWFNAIYLGEHYFSDVIAGIAYATIAYLAVTKQFFPYLSTKISFLKNTFQVNKEKLRLEKFCYLPLCVCLVVKG